MLETIYYAFNIFSWKEWLVAVGVVAAVYGLAWWLFTCCEFPPIDP